MLNKKPLKILGCKKRGPKAMYNHDFQRPYIAKKTKDVKVHERRSCPECGEDKHKDIIRLRSGFYECRACGTLFQSRESIMDMHYDEED